MKHSQNFQTVLSSGFQPRTGAKERVRAALFERVKRPAPYRLSWALAVGSSLVLLGLCLYMFRPYQVELLGPNDFYASNIHAAQDFGECGPLGLETKTDHINFQ